MIFLLFLSSTAAAAMVVFGVLWSIQGDSLTPFFVLGLAAWSWVSGYEVAYLRRLQKRAER